MKTQFSLPGNKATIAVALVMFMIAVLGTSPMYGQSDNATTKTQQNERTITGIISSDDGPLESASVILKGTSIGTVTDNKGEFTFPKLLKTGDILQITFLGFETQDVIIKDNTSVINLTLSEDVLEFVGALNSDVPYKSKRSHK